MTLSISSPGFQEGERIPAKYTCQGQDISPQLDWSGVPKEAKSLALIMDDPDAPGGIFTHWVIFNIPPDSLKLPEAVPTEPQLPGSARQGSNDGGGIGYYGPCPPPGRPHRYRFTIYALDIEHLDGLNKRNFIDKVEQHSIAKAKIKGLYKRK